jgi:short-subunit dehydrogenase
VAASSGLDCQVGLQDRARDRTASLAIVTGASSGIGEATARHLARIGFRVALVARRGDRLERLAARIEQDGGQAFPFPGDLSDEDSRVSVAFQIQERLGPVEVLVNNAGQAWYGYGADMPWPRAASLVQINAQAALHLTLLVLPGMLERHCGHILNVGSVAGAIPSQGVAVYSATKSFLDSLTTALHRELRGTGVHLGIVRPGYVETELSATAAASPKGRPLPGRRFAIRPEQVAEAIGRMIRRPRRVVYVPAWLRLVPWIELTFGWVMDRIGPALLGRRTASPPDSG